MCVFVDKTTLVGTPIEICTCIVGTVSIVGTLNRSPQRLILSIRRDLIASSIFKYFHQVPTM